MNATPEITPPPPPPPLISATLFPFNELINTFSPSLPPTLITTLLHTALHAREQYEIIGNISIIIAIFLFENNRCKKILIFSKSLCSRTVIIIHLPFQWIYEYRQLFSREKLQRCRWLPVYRLSIKKTASRSNNKSRAAHVSGEADHYFSRVSSINLFPRTRATIESCFLFADTTTLLAG